MGEQYVSKFHWYASIPLTIIIAIFGFIGNILSIIVWKRLQKRLNDFHDGFSTFAIALAKADIFVLVFLLLTDTVLVIHGSVENNCNYVYFFCYFGYFTFFYVVFLSIYILVALSLTRLQAIWTPMSRFDKRPYFYYIVFAVIFVWSFLVNVPAMLEYQPHESNGTCAIQKTKYSQTREFQYLLFFTHCLLGAAFPWFTLLVSNVVLYLRYTKSVRQPSQERHKLTYILLAMCVSTLIFLGFQCVTRCFRMLHDEEINQWKAFDDWYAFGKLGIVLNSTANFYIICLPGKLFYRELRRLFMVKRVHPLSPSQDRNVSHTSTLPVILEDKLEEKQQGPSTTSLNTQQGPSSMSISTKQGPSSMSQSTQQGPSSISKKK